ncbi:hypothetical protein HanXRQr2_Chr10g0434161 [Helianthus annuus]|uniref:Uncharacterized protein n=1 Tax=Helianthus annuus TaxID=4232 RepID=A0A9K3HWM3_HELAN|nr:hypothetical protein HanXRQr2_Chr10g0434161 [Helianthus annuus]
MYLCIVYVKILMVVQIIKINNRVKGLKWHLTLNNIKQLKSKDIFIPEVWPVLRLSSEGLFFRIWTPKVKILPFSSSLLTPSIFSR